MISNGIVVSGVERAQWALDNILIGGAEINPSQLVDTFDDGKRNSLNSVLCVSCLQVSDGSFHSEHVQALGHASQPAFAAVGPCSL